MKKILIILAMLLMVSSFVYADTDEPSEWAIENVEELKKTNDFRDEAFVDYQSNITRQEFIYLAVRIFEILDGKPINADASITFTDTDDIYARKGATVGITAGIGNGKFGPNDLLTREQLAVLMINTLNLGNIKLNENNGYAFNDDSEFSSWAKKSIYLAKSNDIVSGVGQDMFNSKGNATVEQAIIITNKMLKNVDKSTWAYDAGTEVVEGVTVNFEEDVDKYGDLKEDVVTQLWEVFIDNLEFTKDENGIMHVKGYVPKAPKGYTSQVWIYVHYKNAITTSKGKIYNFELQSDISSIAPFQYNLEDGNNFNYSMLGKLTDSDILMVSFQVLKAGDNDANVHIELDYLERVYTHMEGIKSKTLDFDWEKVFKW